VALDVREGPYGQAMLDHFHRGDGWEIVEREDGFASIGAGPELYFASFRRWRRAERSAMRFVRGSVLDIGCGAGRAMIHLRERGLEVVGIDNSPGAIEVCRLRGVTGARLLSVEELDESVGLFDTVLLLGGGFGLLGTPARTRRILARLRGVTTGRGRILAANRDPAASGDRDRETAAQHNLRGGRVSGQTRLRIRYRHFATPYFDYFRCAPDEMSTIADGTGWTLVRVLRAGAGEPYVGILEKA
jgi:SAM-dependent methyltransferase